MIFDDLYISKISSAVIGAGTDVNGEFTLMGVRDGDKIIGLFKNYPSMPDFHLVYEGTLTFPQDQTVVFNGTWQLWWGDGSAGEEHDTF